MNRRKRALENLDEDIRAHIEQEIQDNIDRGMTPEEARWAAIRKFGNIARVREDTRAVWIPVWLDQLSQDLHYGLRMLARNRAFTGGLSSNPVFDHPCPATSEILDLPV